MAATCIKVLDLGTLKFLTKLCFKYCNVEGVSVLSHVVTRHTQELSLQQVDTQVFSSLWSGGVHVGTDTRTPSKRLLPDACTVGRFAIFMTWRQAVPVSRYSLLSRDHEAGTRTPLYQCTWAGPRVSPHPPVRGQRAEARAHSLFVQRAAAVGERAVLPQRLRELRVQPVRQRRGDALPHQDEDHNHGSLAGVASSLPHQAQQLLLAAASAHHLCRPPCHPNTHHPNQNKTRVTCSRWEHGFMSVYIFSCLGHS